MFLFGLIALFELQPIALINYFVFPLLGWQLSVALLRSLVKGPYKCGYFVNCFERFSIVWPLPDSTKFISHYIERFCYKYVMICLLYSFVSRFMK